MNTYLVSLVDSIMVQLALTLISVCYNSSVILYIKELRYTAQQMDKYLLVSEKLGSLLHIAYFGAVTRNKA